MLNYEALYRAACITIVAMSVVMSVMLMYIVVLEKRIAVACRQQQEHVKLQTEFMRSQIQPHFLFNALGSIAELCDTEPQKVKQTILQLAKYFRGILDMLNSQELIPFEQEFNQTRQYLELEQMRFGEDLQVAYHIDCTDFLLPPMCLEPLVENAVRHGIRRNPGGRGTIVLLAAEAPDCYQITVLDDGPGIAPKSQSEWKRIHVGISNVQERLRLTCGGTLELVSESGKGVTATIRIPKQKEGTYANLRNRRRAKNVQPASKGHSGGRAAGGGPDLFGRSARH